MKNIEHGLNGAQMDSKVQPPGRTASATGIVIDRLDHLVLTVNNLQSTIGFYVNVLGMKVVQFGEGRFALQFGRQKINLHERGREFEPKADRPLPGSADLCLIADTPLDDVIRHLNHCNVVIEEGPVIRTGAMGKIRSVYVRDPDRNLIEISTYLTE
jgi:catechol 2,3-dioxygenase-like lactoylglutathione lyase family enzyme